MQQAKLNKTVLPSDIAKQKKLFKHRLYQFVLRLIEFLDQLPKDAISAQLSGHLMESGTRMMSNYIQEGKAPHHFPWSSKLVTESKLWLALLRDSKRAKAEEVAWFLWELDEMEAFLAGHALPTDEKRIGCHFS